MTTITIGGIIKNNIIDEYIFKISTKDKNNCNEIKQNIIEYLQKKYPQYTIKTQTMYHDHNARTKEAIQ